MVERCRRWGRRCPQTAQSRERGSAGCRSHIYNAAGHNVRAMVHRGEDAHLTQCASAAAIPIRCIYHNSNTQQRCSSKQQQQQATAAARNSSSKQQQLQATAAASNSSSKQQQQQATAAVSNSSSKQQQQQATAAASSSSGSSVMHRHQ